MTNTIDYSLDVLATSSLREKRLANQVDTYVVDVLATEEKEMNLVAARLTEPSEKLIRSYANEYRKNRNETSARLYSLLDFRPVQDCFLSHKAGSARRFVNSLYAESVDIHLYEVSNEFPRVLFLVDSYGDGLKYNDKTVILAGDVLQQTFHWMPVDIFVPFRVEYERGLPFGSLWERWVADLSDAVAMF
ncbi:MAG: hypothetical protein CXZ00_02480 [Acidobacteria bacterium]|nr:MAG: hypothetical protein CXZ00_02480 [Acidobacteriota bacterium]